MLRRWEYYKIIWFYHLSRQRKEIRKLTFRDFGLTLETSGFESLYGGQFTLSTQLIKPNYLVFTTVSLLRVWFLDLTSKEKPRARRSNQSRRVYSLLLFFFSPISARGLRVFSRAWHLHPILIGQKIMNFVISIFYAWLLQYSIVGITLRNSNRFETFLNIEKKV